MGRLSTSPAKLWRARRASWRRSISPADWRRRSVPAPADLSASLAALPPLREVVRAHGLQARKSLGQNYLFDLNLTRKIARSTGSLDGVTVIEIGPGPGGVPRAPPGEGGGQIVGRGEERTVSSA